MNRITQVVPASIGQIKQINRLIADAVEKTVTEFGLDKNGAQHVIERGNELVHNIEAITLAMLKDLSYSRRYQDEGMGPNYGYMSDYKKPKDITEQVSILRQLFPCLGNANEKLALRSVPKNADDGWFAIPKWQSLAPTYGEAVQLVLNKLKEIRKAPSCNYREGELGPDKLRQSAKTAGVFQKLAEEQDGYDILVIAAQFGFCRRGRLIGRLRENMLPNEFRLGAFAIGIMLLTHPERLNRCEKLWTDSSGDESDPDAHGDSWSSPFFELSIDCSGDESDSDDHGNFWSSPVFCFNEDEFSFDLITVSYVYDNYGYISGFLPL